MQSGTFLGLNLGFVYNDGRNCTLISASDTRQSDFNHYTYQAVLTMSSSQASQRINQVAGHLNYPKGMLAGQVAIITGSGQGIGAEAARLFANEGAKVIVSDIDARMKPPYRCAKPGANSI